MTELYEKVRPFIMILMLVMLAAILAKAYKKITHDGHIIETEAGQYVCIFATRLFDMEMQCFKFGGEQGEKDK